MTDINPGEIRLPDEAHDRIFHQLQIISDRLALGREALFGYIEDDPLASNIRDFLTQVSRRIIELHLPEDMKNAVRKMLAEENTPILFSNMPTDKPSFLKNEEGSPTISKTGVVDELLAVGFYAYFDMTASLKIYTHNFGHDLGYDNGRDDNKSYDRKALQPHNETNDYDLHTVHCVKENEKVQTSWRSIDGIMAQMNNTTIVDLQRKEFEFGYKDAPFPLPQEIISILEHTENGYEIFYARPYITPTTDRAAAALEKLDAAIQNAKPLVYTLRRKDFLIMPDSRGLHDVNAYKITKRENTRWVDIVVGSTTKYHKPYPDEVIDKFLGMVNNPDSDTQQLTDFMHTVCQPIQQQAEQRR